MKPEESIDTDCGAGEIEALDGDEKKCCMRRPSEGPPYRWLEAGRTSA
ncbi:MAG: hypothetical protein GY866_11430 [Proteobacteria bacterium]|nr:hypothetical protein [Pseudomonadota bacterium]